MNRSHNPGILIGLLIGALLTASLIAVFYAAWGLVGLPFVPYDMFDWMARVLPGRVITFAIDTMVSLIRALNVGHTSVVAKTAEHVQAIGGLFISGVFAGGILFGILRMLRGRFIYPLGLALGFVFGIVSTLISLHLSQTASTPRFVSALWIVGIFLLWEAGFGWVYRRLATAGAAGGSALHTV